MWIRDAHCFSILIRCGTIVCYLRFSCAFVTYEKMDCTAQAIDNVSSFLYGMEMYLYSGHKQSILFPLEWRSYNTIEISNIIYPHCSYNIMFMYHPNYIYSLFINNTTIS